uniref:Putative ixodes 10 kDa peptide protein n=1 Tax=Ixodes ricinus TaxID=34613 RepID=A0A0K8RCT3_IXORI
MKLVVFPVVLILPAVLSAGSLSGTQYISDCDGYISQGGGIACEVRGSYYDFFDPVACEVVCQNRERPEFPKGVCSGGNVNCTPEVKTRLEVWTLNLMSPNSI